MKERETTDSSSADNRKAYVERQNRLIQKKQKTPEPSVLGSSVCSHDISLNSLSIKSESEDVKENTFPNISSRSRKPSEVYYECVSSKLSEKDEKILRLMARRRESKMEEYELSFLARCIWEEERLQQMKKAEMQKTLLMERLAKKKKREEIEAAMRKSFRDENLKQEKLLLEMKISEKHEKVERRQKEISLQKKLKPEYLTTKHQIQFHQQLKKQKEKEEEMEKALHRQQFEAKEKRCQEKLKCILSERCRKLKEESLKENLRREEAKNAREEMNRRCEEGRIRRLKHAERSQMLRRERVNWGKEWRRKIVLEKNEREKQQHAIVYNKVKEEEREKTNLTRRRIQVKDSKMKMMKERREESVSRSRVKARMTADLREKMRQTYEL